MIFNSTIKTDAGGITKEIIKDTKKISEYFNELSGYTIEEFTDASNKVHSILHPEGLHGKKWKSHYADEKFAFEANL